MKVIIIGKGSGWEMAPPCGNGATVYGITQLCIRRPVDLTIDMNIYSDGRWGIKEEAEAARAKDLCQTNGIQYICLDNYPLNQVIERFGTDYFTNTVDYAIALALFYGYREMDFYGINMAHGSEYQYQLPGVSFWTGIAMGMGVKVRVFGKGSILMVTEGGRLYGYDMPQLSLTARTPERLQG